ncbi:hypothetical protein [Mesorhizobium sp. Cs1299R1N3]|uniref:hypothetical protein n=1 Tax=Mesorhizobium sp. Cs1299R1N3 TaxID=3015173 RepID=UPI00301C1694
MVELSDEMVEAAVNEWCRAHETGRADNINVAMRAALTASLEERKAEPVAWPEPTVLNPDIFDPTGVPYIDSLLHRLLDAQQDINLAANQGMDQALCDASALIDEVETCIRRLATPPAPDKAVGALDADAIAEALLDRSGVLHPRQAEKGLIIRGIRDALSSLGNERGKPEGYVLVPKIPSHEMITAAAEAHYGKRRVAKTPVEGISITVDGIDYSFVQAFRRFWKGALAASPVGGDQERPGGAVAETKP